MKKVFRKIRRFLVGILLKKEIAMYKNEAGLGTFKFREQISFDNDFSVNVDLFNLTKKKGLVSTTFNGVATMDRDLPFYPWTLDGDLTDGRKISAKGLSLTSVAEGFNKKDVYRTLELSFTELEIGQMDEFSLVEFYIPNLTIGFDNFSRRQGTAVRNTSTLELEIDGSDYYIEFVGIDYTGNLEKEDDDSSDKLTVKLCVKKKIGDVSFNESKDLVEKILDLCSIAYGDRVAWAYAIGFNDQVEKYRIIKDVPFCKLNPFRQLIRVEYPRMLSNYIATCFPSYSSLTNQQRKILNKLVDGLHFSAGRLNFPAPFTSLGSSIEDFASGVLADTDSHYVGKQERRQLLLTFSDWVEQQVIPLLNNQDDISDFDESGKKQKLSGMMQRNLRSRITNLLNHFSIQFEIDWVGSFVKKRNSAAHGTYQYSDGDYDIWSRMAALLEKCILKQVNYTGEYLDWSSSPPEWRGF